MVDAQPILTNSHLECLYPHYLKPPSSTSPIEISSTITLTPTYSIDNSELLAQFKSAYLDDNEWREGLAIQKLPGQPMHWRIKDNLIFHQDCLFVPKSLQLDIIESRHDSILTVHPAITVNITKILITNPSASYSHFRFLIDLGALYLWTSSLNYLTAKVTTLSG